MRRLFLIALSILLLATIAGAQNPEESWDNLKSLRAVEKIQVVDQKLKSQNGIFVSVSDEAITFQAGKDAVTIQRADVFRVSSLEREHSRGRNALIGLGVGAAVGALIIEAAVANGEEVTPPALVGVSLMFGAIGGAIGVALPPGHPTIYRAERRKDTTAP